MLHCRVLDTSLGVTNLEMHNVLCLFMEKGKGANGEEFSFGVVILKGSFFKHNNYHVESAQSNVVQVWNHRYCPLWC